MIWKSFFVPVFQGHGIHYIDDAYSPPPATVIEDGKTVPNLDTILWQPVVYFVLS